MGQSKPFRATALVVEDDPHLAAGIVDNLRAESYGVEAVTDGQLALDWLQQDQCGLIVLDVMLPNVDGFTVCRTLRERRLPRYVHDREAMLASLDRLAALEEAGARIFFGHDPEF